MRLLFDASGFFSCWFENQPENKVSIPALLTAVKFKWKPIKFDPKLNFVEVLNLFSIFYDTKNGSFVNLN